MSCIVRWVHGPAPKHAGMFIALWGPSKGAVFDFCDGSLPLQIRGKWSSGGLTIGAVGVRPCTHFIACSDHSSNLKAALAKFAWLWFTLCLSDLCSPLPDCS